MYSDVSYLIGKQCFQCVILTTVLWSEAIDRYSFLNPVAVVGNTGTFKRRNNRNTQQDVTTVELFKYELVNFREQYN
jgi:hypothetical protein